MSALYGERVPSPAEVDRMLAGAVLRWATENGWQRTYTPHCYRSGDGLVDVYWSADFLNVHIRQHLLDLFPVTVAVPVDSVRRAVDVLAAYEVVPPHFSTLYAAGRASARIAAWSREVTEWRTIWPS